MSHKYSSSQNILGFLFLLLLCVNCTAQDSTMKCISKTMPANCYLNRVDKVSISHIVIHSCSDVLANPEKPYQAYNIISLFRDYKVSPHYLIDRQGTVYCLVPDNKTAKHAGIGKHKTDTLMNYQSIGIELMGIGTPKEMKAFSINQKFYDKIPKEHLGFTEAQYLSLQQLIESLLIRHHNIKRNRAHIIGHDEHSPHRKTDPGSLFDWKKIGF